VALDCVPDLQLASVSARDFYYLELVREKQCVLLPSFHNLAGCRSLRLEELQEESMITGMETSIEARFFRSECKKKGLSFARIYYSDGIETIMELVRNGNGFTLGPESFGDYYHVAAVPLEPSEEQSFSFVCLYSNRNRPELKLFRSYLKGMGSTSCCPE
jgi:DNA-binding transcriptional LysR family regulator